MLKLKEKAYFPHENEKELKSFLNLSLLTYFYDFYRNKPSWPYKGKLDDKLNC